MVACTEALLTMTDGLEQAGKCWNDELDRWLISKGWTANDDDACVYMLSTNSGSIELILYVHVDDQAIAGYTESAIGTQPSRFILILYTHNLLASDKMISNISSLSNCKIRQLPMSPSVLPTLDNPDPADIQAETRLQYQALTAKEFFNTLLDTNARSKKRRVRHWSGRLCERRLQCRCTAL